MFTERPTEEAVRAAAAASGDAELIALVAAPGSFLLRKRADEDSKQDVYDLLVVNASHPPLFRVAVDRQSGSVTIAHTESGGPR
ncbi:hypothetical protein ABZ780_01555 [Micromonospora sp. NPDC047467]|uniref:hypothetical protein n=1 Tax=Micromonospora sp. NPDC047467 TaxID=3154814 RepID=UPI0034007CD9